jgi:hypothetical protein
VSTIDMREHTRRLEPALRHLAAKGGGVADAAKKFGVDKAELWAWLGQFNHSRPSLPAHVIDGVLAGLAERPKKAPKPTGHVRQAVERVAAKPAGPAIAGPIGGPDVLSPWLARQGLPAAAVPAFQVRVTPELAAIWLTLNAGNRKPSRAKVLRFAAVIREGKWILNGEAIKFSASGRLLDGQSRLKAIIEAGVPADLEVRGGLPDAVQQTMDCGETRKGTHTLQMIGEQHPEMLSPTLRLIFKWETGTLGSGSGKVSGSGGILENQAVKPLLERHPGVRESVAWAIQRRWWLQQKMAISEAAFFHYVFAKANRLKRDAFFEALRNGNGMTQPVALLRQRLPGNPRLPAGVRIKLIIKAWNAHHTGRNLAELALAPRESAAPIAGVKREEKAA